MALFKPYRLTTAAMLGNLPIVEGQFIVIEETGAMYFDKDNLTRINIGKDGYTLSINSSQVSLLDSSNTAVSTITVPTVVDAVIWNNEEYPEINYFDCYGKPQIDAMFAALTAADVGAIAASAKGANNGVAELDANGKVLSSQLPSYVDDVLEYADLASFPATGEAGKIYVTLDTNKTYRWSSSAYVEISAGVTLGETSSTAYRGDRGAAAYGHATDANKLTVAQTSGLYKISTTVEGHIASVSAVQKSDITELGIPAQDTTYNTGNTSTAGITKLYTSTGNNTDGAMTQAAVTTLIGDIETLLATV